MSYKQLTEGQRYQIQVYLQQGFSLRQISLMLGVSHSTISREIRRNSADDSYCPVVAHRQAHARRHHSRKRAIDDGTLFFVEYALSMKWSPEQIAGVAKQMGYQVSHEWIYGHEQADRRAGGKLYKNLRRHGRTYRKGNKAKRVIIPNRVGIEHRPQVVEEYGRFGDWEADTVLGKQGTGAIVSLAERKSKLYLIRKVPAKSAKEVRRAMIGMLWRYRRHVHSITADNGTEFCEHEQIANRLNTDVYFANPYAAWERGLNENFNGLLRQYIPKGTDLRKVTDKQLREIEKQLNARPRKCLGYRQPAVVFNELRRAA